MLPVLKPGPLSAHEHPEVNIVASIYHHNPSSHQQRVQIHPCRSHLYTLMTSQNALSAYLPLNQALQIPQYNGLSKNDASTIPQRRTRLCRTAGARLAVQLRSYAICIRF